jgi:hypothetical protein
LSVAPFFAAMTHELALGLLWTADISEELIEELIETPRLCASPGTLARAMPTAVRELERDVPGEDNGGVTELIRAGRESNPGT